MKNHSVDGKKRIGWKLECAIAEVRNGCIFLVGSAKGHESGICILQRNSYRPTTKVSHSN